MIRRRRACFAALAAAALTACAAAAACPPSLVEVPRPAETLEPVRAPAARPVPAAEPQLPAAALAGGSATQPWAVQTGLPVELGAPYVVVVVTTRCGYVRKAKDALLELESSLRARGVRFIYLYPDARDTRGAADAFHAACGFGGDIVIDGAPEIARRMRARRGAEAFVADGEGGLRYRGAIELWDGRGRRMRPLREALEAVLAGVPVPLPATPVPGCPFPL